MEPEEEIRNRARFHTRDSDVPQKPVQKSGRVSDGFTIALHVLELCIRTFKLGLRFARINTRALTRPPTALTAT